MPPERKPPTPAPLDLPQANPPETPVVDSRELLRGGDDLLIRHEGRLYRLKRTRLGKLILTA